MSYYQTSSNAAADSAPPDSVGRAPGKRCLTDALVARRAQTTAASASPSGQPRTATTACPDDPFALHLATPSERARPTLARKAIALDAIADSWASGGAASSFDTVVRRTPAELAAEGTQGSSQPIPHLAAMNESFGMDFSGVESFIDPRSCDELGAHAYATDNKVVFASADPAPAIVAHELSHVLDHTAAGPARKSDRGEDGGIDTSGEPRAEAVEAAVAAGLSASSVLGDRGSVGFGPALRGRGPALDSRWGLGMSFSPEKFEHGGEYNLWSHPGISVPVGAVPGLFFKVSPALKAKANFNVDWKTAEVPLNVAVEGAVPMGLEYGDPNVLSLSANFVPQVGAQFSFTPFAKGSSWNLSGGLAFNTKFSVAVKLIGGLEYAFDFGECLIGKLNGIEWKQGVLQPDMMSWEWGEQPKRFFAMLNDLVAKARELANASREIMDDMVRRFYNQWGIPWHN